MKTLIKLALTALVTAINIFGQVSENWVKTYNGPGSGYDQVTDMKADGSGNVYVTGWIRGAGSEDYYTIKYNTSGTLLWANTFNGTLDGVDDPYSVFVDGSGNVYVTGQSDSVYTGADIVTIKYNSAGVTQWVRRWTSVGLYSDRGFGVTADALGNVFVTGESNGKIVVLKYNSTGVLGWASLQTVPGKGNGIIYDPSGNVYVYGYSGASLLISVTKYRISDGMALWTSSFTPPASGSSEGRSAKIDGSGNIYVTGNAPGTSLNNDYTTVKFSSTGTLLWAKQYNGSGNHEDIAYSLDLDASGNAIVTGSSRSSSVINTEDFITIKYNGITGDSVWTRRYAAGTTGPDIAKCVKADASGNIYVTGYSHPASVPTTECVTLKYNSAGVQQWVIFYNNTSNLGDFAQVLAVDPSNNVYISGYTSVPGMGYDYCTIKYSQSMTGITNYNESPNSFSLEQNFPNPFNPSTTIKYYIPENGNVKLSVYDINGREVTVLNDGFKQKGGYEISFNAANLSTGTYFYKLETANFTDVKKMILIK